MFDVDHTQMNLVMRFHFMLLL